MQSSLELLAVPSASARRRQWLRTVWVLAQHCAAMPVRSSCLETARPTEEVTASSPGHRQKSVLSPWEMPTRMATPDSGMSTTDGGELGGEGGGGGDDGGGRAKGHGKPE